MGFYRAPQIVTNGLVLYLDAANPKSYPGTGITWYDRSGNGNTGTLTNGPTFIGDNNGSIVFDGVNDRVSQNSSIDAGSNFTVSSWIKPTILGTTRRAIVGNSYNYSSRNGWLFSTAGGGINNTFFLSIGADTVGIGAPANTLSVNTWQFVTAVASSGGGAIVLYKNGEVVATYVGTPGIITYTTPQFNVGYRLVDGTTDPFTGNISTTQIYNRALSAAEVLQNFNALKSRFNL